MPVWAPLSGGPDWFTPSTGALPGLVRTGWRRPGHSWPTWCSWTEVWLLTHRQIQWPPRRDTWGYHWLHVGTEVRKKIKWLHTVSPQQPALPFPYSCCSVNRAHAQHTACTLLFCNQVALLQRAHSTPLFAAVCVHGLHYSNSSLKDAEGRTTLLHQGKHKIVVSSFMLLHDGTPVVEESERYCVWLKICIL